MSKNVLGIDISKSEIVVTLLIFGHKHYNHNSFSNDKDGFKKLEDWMQTLTSDPAEIYLEATGTYGDNLTEYFYQKGYVVKVINPLQIKSFARTILSRHKTDRVDATIIAEYGSKFEALAYKPLAQARKELRALYRCSLAILEQITYCINQLEHKGSLPATVVGIWESAKSNFELQLLSVEQQMKEIISNDEALLISFNNLQTINGIGARTAMSILAEIPRISDFKSARQLAAFLGLTPKQKQSGTSVYGRSRISKMGSSIMRRALFFPAMAAMRFNQILKEFAQKLELRGKSKKSIICAVMRKLTHIIFGVLKNNKPFDANMWITKN